MDIIRELPNNKHKNHLLNLENYLKDDTIAFAQRGNQKKYICFADTGFEKLVIDRKDDYIIPYFNFKTQDRLLIIVNGFSRSGKSVFMKNYILDNFKKQHHSRKIFYICPTHFNHDDNLKNEKMIFIDANHEYLADDPIQHFTKSLVIFDDIDSIKNTSIWKLFALLVNVGGKFNIDLIFITHSNTVVIPSLKLNLVTDCDFYVTYNISNNRFFNNYNRDAPIAEFVNDILVTCRPKFRILIGDKRIIKY